jgi:hypothetical protein
MQNRLSTYRVAMSACEVHSMDLLQLNPLLGRTNAPHSDEETTELRHQLPILEIEHHRLETDISLLLAKRARLVNHIDRCRIAVAPHKRLPPELIGQILLRCVGGPAVLPLADGKNNTRLVITQICSAWRSIAFDVAELWDVIFDFLGSTRLSPESLGCVDLTGAWLSQCNSNSLSLRVLLGLTNTNFDAMNDNVKRLDHIIDSVVIPNTHRFSVLMVVLSHHGAKSLLTLPSDSFPALEQVFIVYNNITQPLLTCDIPITAFSLASRLSVGGILSARAVIPNFLQLPWSQLLSLLIQYRPQTANTCATVLSSCTSLISLCIDTTLHDEDGMLPVSRDWRPQVPIHLWCLQRLVITFDMHLMGDMLSMLKLPRLQRLHFMQRRHVFSDASIWWSLPAFTTFLMSLSSLEAFEISDFAGRLVSTHQSHRNMEGLIACIPAVKVVQLSDTFPLLPSTMARIGTGALLPQAEHLEFAAQDPCTVIEMLTTRQATALATVDPAQAVSRLRKVEVRCSQVVPLEMVSRLQSEGLQIRTRTS